MCIRFFHLLLLSVLYISQCGAKNNAKGIISIRIEFIGETDKAPPVVIAGLKRPGGIKQDERFYMVSGDYLNSVMQRCMLNEPSDSIGGLLIKITISDDTGVSVFKLADSVKIGRVLKCMIDLSENQQYGQLSFDIERILKKCN